MPSPACAVRLCLAGILAIGLFGLSARQADPVGAALPTVNVGFVVRPVRPSTALYRRDANAIYTVARRHTTNVVRVYTPYATWSRVVAAARGASVFVYFGHGNGYPSRYGAYR